MKSKDVEIHDLMKTIDALNNVIKLDDSDSDTEEVEDEDQIETVLESDDDDIFSCDECEFRTRKKTGLKIHKSKIHVKVKCNTCYREFTTKEKLKRHVESETTLGNICDKVSQKKDFELKENLADENCLGIFNTSTPREDGFPSLFLHSEECWNLSGHSCPNLPDSRRFPDPDFDPIEDGTLLDHDTYEPTLHTTISMLVLGDLTEKGCYPDWTKAEKMLRKFTKET